MVARIGEEVKYFTGKGRIWGLNGIFGGLNGEGCRDARVRLTLEVGGDLGELV